MRHRGEATFARAVSDSAPARDGVVGGDQPDPAIGIGRRCVPRGRGQAPPRMRMVATDNRRPAVTIGAQRRDQLPRVDFEATPRVRGDVAASYEGRDRATVTDQ